MSSPFYQQPARKNLKFAPSPLHNFLSSQSDGLRTNLSNNNTPLLTDKVKIKVTIMINSDFSVPTKTSSRLNYLQSPILQTTQRPQMQTSNFPPFPLPATFLATKQRVLEQRQNSEKIKTNPTKYRSQNSPNTKPPVWLARKSTPNPLPKRHDLIEFGKTTIPSPLPHFLGN